MGRILKSSTYGTGWGWFWSFSMFLLTVYSAWLWVTGVLVVFRTADTSSVITRPNTLWIETLVGALFALVLYVSYLVFTYGMNVKDKMKGPYVYEMFLLKCLLLFLAAFVLFAVFRFDYCDDVDCNLLTTQLGGISPGEKDIMDRLLTYKILNAILIVFMSLIVIAYIDKIWFGFIHGQWMKMRGNPTGESGYTGNKKKSTLL